jgi:tellurite methyltransferase
MASTQDLNVQDWFGGIDIYLFDQVLKDRLHPSMRLLDAGCGNGRNLVYFFRTGYEVFAVDQSPEAIAQVRLLASSLAPNLSPDHFRVESVDKMSFPAADFELVISSAVLHFARDDDYWLRLVTEMWRVLAPGGIFFARLASTVGIDDEIKLIAGRRYHLPDGSERFLVDEQLLLATTESLGGEWLEPLKTVVVHHARSMTTWCLRKTGVAQIR